MANIAKHTITKRKQKAFLTLFYKIAEMKGSKNKAADFCNVNKEAIYRCENDNFMTLETGKRILTAYNKTTQL